LPGDGEAEGVSLAVGDAVSGGVADLSGDSDGSAVGECFFFRWADALGDGVGEAFAFLGVGDGDSSGTGEGFFFLGDAAGDGVGDSFSEGDDSFKGLGVGVGDFFFVAVVLFFFRCGVGVGVEKIFLSVLPSVCSAASLAGTATDKHRTRIRARKSM
jgi:hypothetical protein